jgi:DtxR family Mn-dependent transcriptional regulator
MRPELITPATALVVFGIVVALAAALLWPRFGIVALARRLTGQTERVRLEDALKHLYTMESAGARASVDSTAGALGVTRTRAVRILGRLEQQQLARSDGAGIPLTDAGREYALRVVRAHRLWERYLADRTGVAARLWHSEAERKEHELSAAEAESLAERMGRPMYDPHGDPIPTADGDVPPRPGRALSSLGVGESGVITHVEDEPQEAYDKLLAAGLSPGMPVEVVETTPTAVRFVAAGRRQELAPVIAANVTVASALEGTTPVEWVTTLADIEVGGRARVLGISPACQGAQRRRLLDLGVVPGTVIAVEMTSASGDPVAYRIRGAMIALRSNQADWIHVSPVPGTGSQSTGSRVSGNGEAA